MKRECREMESLLQKEVSGVADRSLLQKDASQLREAVRNVYAAYKAGRAGVYG